MRKIARLSTAILILSVTSGLTQAQDTAQLCPCPGPKPPGIGRQKAQQCRAEYQRQGLRGDDLINYTAVCVEETRLACLKRAAAEKVHAPARRQFLAQCMGA